MEKLTISVSDIIYNNFFLATLCGLLSLLLLFIDRCIFIKKNNYITYIKLFFLVFIMVYLVLLFKNMNYEENTNINIDINNSPFD